MENRKTLLATDSSKEIQQLGREYVSNGYRDGCPILPCGPVKFKTGENKYFNVYENGEATFEIYKKLGSDKLVIVSTSGKQPIYKLGQNVDFVHDQTGRTLFTGKMVDWINVDKDEKSFDEIVRKYGTKSMSMYVYK